MLKFFSMHLHTGFSVYDGIGTPEDYAKWMLKNAGEDSGGFAISEHGHMNSIGSIAAMEAKYKKTGAPVKILKAIESYFIPSLSDWKQLKEKTDLEKKEEKKKKKIEENNEIADLVIEDEKESKNNRFDPINRRNHLVLVAYNQTGLTNLFTLVSRSHREGFYRKPRIDLSMLQKFNEGLFASSGCLIGVPGWCSQQISTETENRQQKIFELYDKEVAPLMEIFGQERFFFELQFNKIPVQQTINLDIIEYAKLHNFKLIATADSHYSSPDLFRDRELYRLLGYQMQSKHADMEILTKNIEDLDAELYLKNGDQMFDAYKKTFWNHFKDEQLIKNSIEITHDIAHNFCENVVPDPKVKLPKSILVQNNKTPFETLSDLVLSELKNKKLNSKEYIDRAVYELKIIKKLGVEQYFLTLKEILDVIRKNQLTGCGRGSAGGSLVAYLLNIHFLDPVKYGLIFERFLSPSRAELPDIDSDTEDKDAAFELIKEHFGSDNVLAITNYNRLNLKSLVKDISKLYGIPFEESNACTSVMEKEAKDLIMEEIGHDQKLYELTFEKTKQHSKTFQEYLKKYPKIEEHIENLYKEIRSLGKHAGGLLLVPDAEKHIPIIRIRETDQCPVSEGITAQHLKFFGLVKFDILALATLKVIRRCIELILKNKQIEPSIENVWKFYNENLHPDVINTEDENIFKKVYHAGNFPGIFQFAEKGVQRFCTRAKPKNILDISNITGLFRPGPLCLSGDSDILVSLDYWNGRRNPKTKKLKEIYDNFLKKDKRYSPFLISIDKDTGNIIKNNILSVYSSGKKEVYSLKYKVNLRHYDNKSEYDSSNAKRYEKDFIMKCSSEHLFLTSTGWKKLKDIQVGDYVSYLRHYKNRIEDSRKHTRKNNNVKGRKTFRDNAFENYIYKCIFCDWQEASLDVNHIDGNRNINNSIDNLCFLCPNHHKMFTENKISKEEVIKNKNKYLLPTKGDEIRFVRIIGKKLIGEEETYDISVESPHNNFIAGGFVVHNSGHADKKYLDKDQMKKKEHPIIEEVLGKTRNLLLYQEQFMQLAHKLAGFSFEEADTLRKILVKPSTELGEELKKKRQEYREMFVKGCIEKGLSEERASKLWNDEILGFISYGFNFSHSLFYAFNSYHCAYLYTYHEDQWIKACLELDPNPEESVKSIRKIGYKIEKVSINQSDANEWKVKDKCCIPAFTSLKGIGITAAEEIVRNRVAGFNNFSDFLFDTEGNWKLQKINKKTIEILCKVEAFDFLVGKDKQFKNHRHVHDCLVPNIEQLKKKKLKLEDISMADVKDWSVQEKVSFQKELRGFYDKNFIIEKYQDIFDEFKIKAIDETDDKQNKEKVWIIIESVIERTTKTKKPFIVVKCSGKTEKQYELKAWNAKKNNIWKEGNVIVISLDYDSDYGFSLSRQGSVLVL